MSRRDNTASALEHDVSVVVLSFNSLRHLERGIPALIRDLAVTSGTHELWIVDNGSTDGSRSFIDRVAGDHPELVRPIYLDRNRGTTVSRNLALRELTGRYIAILDSDVEVQPGTLGRMIAALEANSDCGILAPRLVFPDGRPQLSCDVFPTLPRKLFRFVALRAIEGRVKEGGNAAESFPVDYAISAFWLFRAELLHQVGFLDERIYYSPEDVDFCIRVWAAGKRVMLDPRFTAVHDAQERSRGFLPSRFSWSHLWGLFYLFGKHRYAFGRRRLYRRIGRFGRPQSAKRFRVDALET